MIESAWRTLASGSSIAAQTRVDGQHPHDIYADFEPPDRIGLVVVTASQPPLPAQMRAVVIEERQRPDDRWALRLLLSEPRLRPVFAALCQDIIDCTRSGVSENALGGVVVRRVLHWRSLLEAAGGGLGEEVLRGLIGELTILSDRLLPTLLPETAVQSWTGPLGTPQDFQLPNGHRLEVKTIARTADQVRVNGLRQLDGGRDPLTLVVVRVEATGTAAPGAISATSLVAALRRRLELEPVALALFDASLTGLGWHDHPAHEALTVRVASVEDYEVDDDFPRLTGATVPAGVSDADYLVVLPGAGRVPFGAAHDG